MTARRAMRDFVAAMFEDERTATESDVSTPVVGCHSPSEGRVTPGSYSGDEMHDFTRDLFESGHVD